MFGNPPAKAAIASELAQSQAVNEIVKKASSRSMERIISLEKDLLDSHAAKEAANSELAKLKHWKEAAEQSST